jgi:hypothetical protein
MLCYTFHYEKQIPINQIPINITRIFVLTQMQIPFILLCRQSEFTHITNVCKLWLQERAPEEMKDAGVQ